MTFGALLADRHTILVDRRQCHEDPCHEDPCLPSHGTRYTKELPGFILAENTLPEAAGERRSFNWRGGRWRRERPTAAIPGVGLRWAAADPVDRLRTSRCGCVCGSLRAHRVD
jgi:hypothetical protein